MTLNAKIGGFTDSFRDIGLRKSISFTRGATVANATMADVYYGPDEPSPSDMRFSKL